MLQPTHPAAGRFGVRVFGRRASALPAGACPTIGRINSDGHFRPWHKFDRGAAFNSRSCCCTPTPGEPRAGSLLLRRPARAFAARPSPRALLSRRGVGVLPSHDLDPEPAGLFRQDRGRLLPPGCRDGVLHDPDGLLHQVGPVVGGLPLGLPAAAASAMPLSVPLLAAR